MNLLGVAHYLEALEWQRDVIKIHALLGVKNPHPQTLSGGGHGETRRPDQPERPQCRQHRHHEPTCREKSIEFVDEGLHARPPGRCLVSTRTGPRYGAGIGNYHDLRGVSQRQPEQQRQPAPSAGDHRGQGSGARYSPWIRQKIIEYVTHSWYRLQEGDQKGKHPWDGETSPRYYGAEAPV